MINWINKQSQTKILLENLSCSNNKPLPHFHLEQMRGNRPFLFPFSTSKFLIICPFLSFPPKPFLSYRAVRAVHCHQLSSLWIPPNSGMYGAGCGYGCASISTLSNSRADYVFQSNFFLPLPFYSDSLLSPCVIQFLQREKTVSGTGVEHWKFLVVALMSWKYKTADISGTSFCVQAVLFRDRALLALQQKRKVQKMWLKLGSSEINLSRYHTQRAPIQRSN